MLRSFDNFWLSLADKVTTEIYDFVYLIVKIILISFLLLITFSIPAADRTQYFVHLSFKSTLQLLRGILRDIQKLLKYFNGEAIVTFFRIPLAVFGAG